MRVEGAGKGRREEGGLLTLIGMYECQPGESTGNAESPEKKSLIGV